MQSRINNDRGIEMSDNAKWDVSFEAIYPVSNHACFHSTIERVFKNNELRQRSHQRFGFDCESVKYLFVITCEYHKINEFIGDVSTSCGVKIDVAFAEEQTR
jgi:hypothetical protein